MCIIMLLALSDVPNILQEVHARLRLLEEEEREKERQRLLAEENRNRILPRPEPTQRVSAQDYRHSYDEIALHLTVQVASTGK